jgi:hypothetical protein
VAIRTKSKKSQNLFGHQSLNQIRTSRDNGTKLPLKCQIRISRGNGTKPLNNNRSKGDKSKVLTKTKLRIISMTIKDRSNRSNKTLLGLPMSRDHTLNITTLRLRETQDRINSLSKFNSITESKDLKLAQDHSRLSSTQETHQEASHSSPSAEYNI